MRLPAGAVMVMNRLKFTRAVVTGLSCPSEAQKTFFWDGTLPGFGLCVRTTGLKSWVVQYRTADGKSRRVTLGDMRAVSLDDARKKAREHLSRANLGHDPQAEKAAARRAVRLESLIDDYLSDVKLKHSARYQTEVERHLRKQARPLHNEAAAGITRADIDDLLKAVRSGNGPIAANRLRASLSALWTWALRTGRIEGENQVAHVPRPTNERTRERVLTDAELALIWRCTAGSHDHDRIVRLLLLTGARREEAGSMQWGELEISAGNTSGLWLLPRHRSKNRLPHEVPLGSLAIGQLPERRENSASVFGLSQNGFSGWSRCKARLDARMLKTMRDDAPDDDTGLEPWTLHDLRRTFSTRCNENGVEPHVVEALLNHVSGSARRGVAGVYNRAAYRAQKAAALAKWEAYIRDLAGMRPATSNVVSIRGVAS